MDVFAPYEAAQRAAEEDQHHGGQNRQRAAAGAGTALLHSLHTSLGLLMACKEGRDFLRWLIQICRCFEALPPAAQAHSLIHTEGRRFVGMHLLRLLQESDAGHLPRLLQPEEDDHGRT